MVQVVSGCMVLCLISSCKSPNFSADAPEGSVMLANR